MRVSVSIICEHWPNSRFIASGDGVEFTLHGGHQLARQRVELGSAIERQRGDAVGVVA
jgi:hypothetical protein